MRFDPGKEETRPRWQTAKLQMGKMINSGKCDNLPGGGGTGDMGVGGLKEVADGQTDRQTDRQVQDGQPSVEEETLHLRGSR